MINKLMKNLPSLNLNTTINYFIVLYAFMLPISKAGTVFSELLLIFLWLVEGHFKEKYNQLKSSHFIITLLFFIIFSTIAITWSSDIDFAFKYLKKYWHFLLIPIIFTSLNIKYLNNIFSGFLLGMFISEIISYGIFFELWTKQGVPANDPSPFMDHTNYSIYLAFTIFTLLHRLIYETSIKWKVIYGIYMVFSLSNMLANGGRTGQVAFFLTLIVVALLNTKHKIRAIVGSIAIGAIIFTAAYSISPIFHNRANQAHSDIKSMITKNDFTNSMSIRVSLWIMGTHAFLDNPILGTGIGDEAKGIKKYIEKYEFYYYKEFKGSYIDYHNTFVQYAAQLGIIGLTLLVILFTILLRLKFKSKVYGNLNITFVRLFLLLSTIGLSLHIMASMVFFSLFSGVFNAISKYEIVNNADLYHSSK